MPQAANLTVNNGAAVSKTFTLVTPAAGDGGVAEWALKEGLVSTAFPTFTAMATKTSNNSRKLQIKLKVPASYTDAATGQTSITAATEMNATFSVPNSFPESMKDDHVAFATNLLNTVLVKSMIRDAYGAV